MKFGVVVKHRATWPVEILCKALGVSRSGFYAWLVRPESAHAQADARIGADVRASFLLSDRTLGGRCHVRVDERMVAVRRRGHRSVCASRRRLVHARAHDGAARDRCADHGGLASRRSPSAGPSFGPRQSIFEQIVSTTAPRTRRDVQYESGRQRVGQFRDGALLLRRSKPNVSRGNTTPPAMPHARMCLTISNASTIRSGGTPPWATSARSTSSTHH